MLIISISIVDHPPYSPPTVRPRERGEVLWERSLEQSARSHKRLDGRGKDSQHKSRKKTSGGLIVFQVDDCETRRSLRKSHPFPLQYTTSLRLTLLVVLAYTFQERLHRLQSLCSPPSLLFLLQ
jgi:hypothetical protein